MNFLKFNALSIIITRLFFETICAVPFSFFEVKKQYLL